MCQNIHPRMCQCQVFFLSSPLVTPYSVPACVRVRVCMVYANNNNNNNKKNNSLPIRLTCSSPSLLLLSLFPFPISACTHTLFDTTKNDHWFAIFRNSPARPRLLKHTVSVCLGKSRATTRRPKTQLSFGLPLSSLAPSLFLYFSFVFSSCPYHHPCQFIFSLFSVLSKLPLLTSLFLYFSFFFSSCPYHHPSQFVFSFFSFLSKLPLSTSLSRSHHMCTKTWRRHLSSLPPYFECVLSHSTTTRPTSRTAAPRLLLLGLCLRFGCSSSFPFYLVPLLRVRFLPPSHVSSLYIYSVWTL